MSTIVYDQEYDSEINTVESLAKSLEDAAKILREKGEVQVYLGGTVHAHIDLKENFGVSIIA